MEPTAKDLEVERGAFRVDVCGHQFSVPAEQAAASDMEKQLLQLLQPGTARLRAQAAAATQAGVSAIEALSSSALARLRRTRRRESTAAVDSPASRLFSDDDESWTADAATGIVCSGLDVVASAVGRGVSIATCDKVVDGVATLSIGGTVLGVLALARDDVLAPFASGVMESVAALMNRHARMHADVRFAWTLLLAPGTVRVCLVEQDAMHVTRAQSLGSDGGRRLVASVVALAGVGEAWRLGRDPTMRAYEGGWEITCPGDGTPRAVYAQRDPVFAADTFFGRFTRCFLVALDPGGSPDYVLKDSWQLVLVEEELNDEVCVLRRVTNALAGVECSGGVFQRLVCGGTVRVNGDDDSSRLVLGGALDTYARWTVAHGARRSAAAHRLHRRMVTGPVGMALHSLDSERDAVAAVAGAMVAHASVLDHAATLHRDVSLGNVLAVRINGVIRGMLIDFDHAVDVDSLRNQRMPGHVGTAPFMSISNLEGLDVPRTAADDWEAALALLLCLAARPLHRDALCARLAAVGSSSGVAEFRRDVFASQRSLDAAIDLFADPQCVHALRLARALHSALFAHPSCPGTARRMLRGNRLIDPILRRVHYASAIHARCLDVVTSYLASTESQTENSMALPKLQDSPSFSSSVGSGSTATLQPPPSAIPPVHPLLPSAACGLAVLRNKRKAHVDVEASPRVKRRKMTCDESGGFAPANFPSTVPLDSAESRDDSSTVVGSAGAGGSFSDVLVENTPCLSKKRKLF